MNDFPPPPPGGQPPAGGQPPYEPPTQPMQPAQPGQPDPYAQQQYAEQPQRDPYAELDSKRKKQLGILSAVAAILIVAAFFGGKAVEKKNYEEGQDGYNEIYNAGAASGAAAGKKAGQAQGQKSGEAEGTEKGKQQGVAEGTADGAAAALGNFSNWSTTTPYVITMDQGSGDVPYTVASRTLMQPDTFYKICASGSGVCTEADNNSSGGGSTGTSP